MPAIQARFQNAQTWKQISTNVPHDVYRTLRSRVTKTRTMSHLLRELISESELMKVGKVPRPSWSIELTEHIEALRDEITAEKQVREDVEKALFELRKEIAELRKEVISETPETQEEQESDKAQAGKSSGIQPEKEKPSLSWPPIFGRLTEMLGVARKTA